MYLPTCVYEIQINGRGTEKSEILRRDRMAAQNSGRISAGT